jgi:uncharacterized protein (DUF305 family)
MNKLSISLLALVGTAAIATALVAQTPTKPAAPAVDHSKMDHSKMNHGAVPANATPSTKAFMAANDKMHAEMAIKFTGDADIDFIKGMLPHHVGAVDMAKIVLEHGKDPEVRKLAAEIIKAQDVEIAFMKAWLAKKGK